MYLLADRDSFISKKASSLLYVSDNRAISALFQISILPDLIDESKLIRHLHVCDEVWVSAPP